jgi:hypothetical protein
MSDHQRNQKQQQPQAPGWMRASPMRGPAPPARLMSPGGVPRQRSPTPTFNARTLVNNEQQVSFNPQQQSPTPPLRRMPPTPTGFTTVYDSSRFTPVMAPSPQPFRQTVAMSPVNFPPPDNAIARPYRSTFSPIPSNAPTPSSIPPFSPQPQPQYMYMDKGQNVRPASDVYVVPLEPSTLPKEFVVHDPEDGRMSTAEIIAQQSQEYVDEKLAEYQATISLLQGE